MQAALTTRTSIAVLAAALCCHAAAAEAEGPALGAAGFIPTAAHPVGFRGDGTGVFPGAAPPTSWDVAAGTNVRWTTPMPSWSFSSPIVVGDRVFTLAEPHTLVCLDASTGRVLWQRGNDPLELLDAAEAARARAAFQGEIDKQIEAWHHVWKTPGWRAGKDGKPYAFSTHESGCYTKGSDEYKASAKIRQQLAADYGLCFETWPGWIGHTFATPCSDGDSVYVSFGFGQVVCYALDGTRRWIRWFRPDPAVVGNPRFGGYPNSHFTPSPLLWGDRLYIQAGEYVRALDKATGKTIWEARYDADRFFIGSLTPMTVNGEDYLVSGHKRIYRVRDGEVVAEGLPASYGSPLVRGDRIYYALYGRHRSTDGKTLYAHQVRPGAKGKLEIERLWALNGPTTWVGLAEHEGRLYCDGWVLDAAAGASRAHLKTGMAFGAHPVVAGGLLFSMNHGGRTHVVRLGETPAVVGAGQVVNAWALKRGSGMPAGWTLTDWWNRGGYGLAAVAIGTPFFQGRRMYIRSADAVHCIEARD